MKTIFFLIIFTFGFSLNCFPQSDAARHFTDIEVTKINNYITDLEKKITAANPSENLENKELIAGLINNPSHDFSDLDLIKISKYIKGLEKKDSINRSSNIASADKKDINNALVIVSEAVVKFEQAAEVSKQVVAYQSNEEKEMDKFVKTIFFNRRTDTLKEESYRFLDTVVTILKKYPDLHFEVEGHTDSVGTVYYNMDLSKKRALTVMDYFIAKGVPETRLSAIGYGKSKPIDTNGTLEGRSKNRRVEIKIKR